MTTLRASFASRVCSADICPADLCSADRSTFSGNVSRRSLGAGRAFVSRWKGIARHVLVASLFLVVLGAALPSWATTYTATSTADSGAGSLRAALGMAANGDTINFDPSLNGQTITLDCTDNGPIILAQNVTIAGPGASNLAISGNNACAVFQVNSGITATFSGVTIENGSTSFPQAGCGIDNKGTLTVSNSVLSRNSCNADGGGIYTNKTPR